MNEAQVRLLTQLQVELITSYPKEIKSNTAKEIAELSSKIIEHVINIENYPNKATYFTKQANNDFGKLEVLIKRANDQYDTVFKK